jgi:glycerol-3-phosphate acyltransferase PlsY
MTFLTKWIIIAVEAYLLGSLSFSIIVSKGIYKKDIRSFGSGNAGMTNVMRTAGFLPGIITFGGDFIKALVAVALGKYLLPYIANLYVTDLTADTLAVLPVYGALLTGFFCLLGHVFPLFFGFRGGKGIVTAAGTMLIIDWRLFLLEVAVFATLFLITRIISVASLTAAVTYPLTAWLCFGVFSPVDNTNAPAYTANTPLPMAVFVPVAAACIAALVIYKHKDNIKRIIKGEEKKLTLKKNK